VVLLVHISKQLASLSNNATVGAADYSILSSFDHVDGSVPISSLLCNILWFLSLGFSLICALSATLVEQWARKYLQATYVKPAPQQRARLSAYLFEGIEKYKMSAIVETIPMLLHMLTELFNASALECWSSARPYTSSSPSSLSFNYRHRFQPLSRHSYGPSYVGCVFFTEEMRMEIVSPSTVT